MKLVTMALLVALATGNAHAQGTTVMGGQVACAQWTNSPQVRATMRHWVMGYMSGFNMNVLNEVDILYGYTTEGVIGWIDKYCRENPLELLTTGVVQLTHMLADRVGASRIK